VAQCPLDEMNRPAGSVEPQLRVPPSEAEIEQLFAGWRDDLALCRECAPAARNYTAARLSADVGQRRAGGRQQKKPPELWTPAGCLDPTEMAA